MNGQIPLAGGRPVRTEDGRRGFVFEQTPEARAFSRWQRGQFLELEHQHARAWRSSLTDLDLYAVPAGLRAMGVDARSCKSLEEAKSMAESIVGIRDRPVDLLKLAALFIGIPDGLEREILGKWGAAGNPPLPLYAPYAAHVLTVELFFQIALSAGHIAVERPSNRIDIAYLFYLPFCMVFISFDRLHRRCSQLFLRSDQEFVWGGDLKEDLKRLNGHYLSRPESEREAGIMAFAKWPPETGEYLVSQLWDRHLKPWRGKALEPQTVSPESEKRLAAHLTKFSEAPTLPPEEMDFGSTEADGLAIHRLVNRKRGSWWQVPKDRELPDEG